MGRSGVVLGIHLGAIFARDSASIWGQSGKSLAALARHRPNDDPESRAPPRPPGASGPAWWNAAMYLVGAPRALPPPTSRICTHARARRHPPAWRTGAPLRRAGGVAACMPLLLLRRCTSVTLEASWRVKALGHQRELRPRAAPCPKRGSPGITLRSWIPRIGYWLTLGMFWYYPVHAAALAGYWFRPGKATAPQLNSTEAAVALRG